MSIELGKVYVMEPVDHAASVLRFSSCAVTSCWQNVYTGLDTRKWRYVRNDQYGDHVFEWVDDPSISIASRQGGTFRFVEVQP